MHGAEVKGTREVKYLGITLDQKVLWKTHVLNINRKVTRALITSMFIIGKNTPDIHYYRKVNDYLCSGNLGGQNLTQYNSQIVTETSKIGFRVHQ